MPKVFVRDEFAGEVDASQLDVLRVSLQAEGWTWNVDPATGTVVVGSALAGCAVAVDLPFSEAAAAELAELSGLLRTMLHAAGARPVAAGARVSLVVRWTAGDGVDAAGAVEARYRGIPGGDAWAAARRVARAGVGWPLSRAVARWDLSRGWVQAVRLRGTLEIRVASSPEAMRQSGAEAWADAMYALLLAVHGRATTARQAGCLRRALTEPAGRGDASSEVAADAARSTGAADDVDDAGDAGGARDADSTGSATPGPVRGASLPPIVVPPAALVRGAAGRAPASPRAGRPAPTGPRVPAPATDGHGAADPPPIRRGMGSIPSFVRPGERRPFG